MVKMFISMAIQNRIHYTTQFKVDPAVLKIDATLYSRPYVFEQHVDVIISNRIQ